MKRPNGCGWRWPRRLWWCCPGTGWRTPSTPCWRCGRKRCRRWARRVRRLLLAAAAAARTSPRRLGVARGRPRLLVAGGVIGSPGWRWKGWPSSIGLGLGLPVRPRAGPDQPALGWGALLFALSCAMLVAIGLARLGRCRGDVFVVAAILLTGLSILLFIGLPLLSVLASAVRDDAGHTDVSQFLHKLTDGSIWGSAACTRRRLRLGVELAGDGIAGGRDQHGAGTGICSRGGAHAGTDEVPAGLLSILPSSPRPSSSGSR